MTAKRLISATTLGLGISSAWPLIPIEIQLGAFKVAACGFAFLWVSSNLSYLSRRPQPIHHSQFCQHIHFLSRRDSVFRRDTMSERPGYGGTWSVIYSPMSHAFQVIQIMQNTPRRCCIFLRDINSVRRDMRQSVIIPSADAFLS